MNEANLPEKVVLRAREVRFDWTGLKPAFVPDEPFVSHLLNVLHILLPEGERWFVKIFSEALPLIKDGRVRALAISSEAPDPNFPGVPTFRELGYEDVDVPAWSGVLAPRGMPPEQAQALYKQFSEAARQPVFQDYLKLSQAQLVLMTPEQFAKALEADVARFRKVLPELGIEAE